MKKLLFLLLTITFLITSCGIYNITQKGFVMQLKENQNVNEILHWTPIGFTEYPSNKLDRIVCLNSKGEYVYLYPNQNTTVKITFKSSEKEFKAYFDTVIYKDGKLYGLRSRIVGGLQEIGVDDIDTIEFHAELPKTKKLNETEIKEIQNKQD